MAGIVIKPRARILHGHDWVFSSEVLKVFGNPADGDVISLKDGKDHLIGSAIYNSKSQIVARRFSRRRQDLDQDFFRRRIAQASEYRDRRNIDPKLRRVVWSESDGLPGVIIDRYGDDFVLQTLTLAMDMRKDLIMAAMVDLFTATSLLSNETTRRFARRRDWNYAAAFCAELHRKSRSKSKVRSSKSIFCAGTRPVCISIKSTITELSRDYARDRRVLDCFTNQGAFALTCARAGATEVTGIEENSENISAAKRNAARNELKIDWVQQDVFQFLRGAEKAGAQYDLIVLDPPSFTRTKSGVRDALRGYRELHMRAFKLLSKDGLLATFSCSHHVDDAAFLQTITDALVDARRSARRLRRFEQAPDHPVLPTIPETEYFRGFLLEMMPGR